MMGWKFYDLQAVPLPDIHDIVWCKWPYAEDQGSPGKVARPVLVRETEVRVIDGVQFGSLVVSYCSGEGIEENINRHFCIPMAREIGLHKPTRFSLNPRDRKKLPWAEDYFVPPAYVKNAGIKLGRFTSAQSAEFRRMLAARGSGLTD
jgi:hypothetical protein